MLSAGRTFVRASKTGIPLPEVEELRDLYRYGCHFRRGEVVMIAGRSGSQKSGFALWLVTQMRVPTLYFSADMSIHTAGTRVTEIVTGHTEEQIDGNRLDPDRRREYERLLAEVPITFSFKSPITQYAIENELNAYIELWDAYPEVIVVDNLKDMDGAESEYIGQMEAMAALTEIARATGSTVIVMHHASDKSWDAKDKPFAPPSRAEIKNGLSENPELSLSVALEPNRNRFRIAVIKQRSGPCDPTARTWVELHAVPETTSFYRLREDGND